MTSAAILKAPFPYFGGKSRIAAAVWERFGTVQNYVEPFFGSGAVLLGCPWPGHTETVNDADGLLANFWRALRADPDAVAEHADYPVSELDLHARHRWLVAQRADVERLLADPEWYDPKAAGWWVWGISQWIGTGWCPQSPAGIADVGELPRQLPHVGNAGMGVHRATNAHAGGALVLPHKRPIVAGTGGRTHRGLGVHRASLSRQLPELGGNSGATGRGIHRETIQETPGALYAYFEKLQARLRRVRVCCGDFARVLGPSVTYRHGLTAVLLDPPYADGEHAVSYSGGNGSWARACRWCEENGDNPLLRIALCGYADTWQAPAGWVAMPWKAHGGYGSQGEGRGRENAAREVVWFSPACLNPAELARDAMTRPLPARGSDFTGTLFDESETA